MLRQTYRTVVPIRVRRAVRAFIDTPPPANISPQPAPPEPAKEIPRTPKLRPHSNLSENFLFLQRGGWRVLSNYPGRDELYKLVTDALYSAAEEIGGKDAVAKLREVGLTKIHTVVPGDRLLELGQKVKKQISSKCYAWSHKVGREYLGLDGDFLVDANVVVRIHLPDRFGETITIPEDETYKTKFIGSDGKPTKPTSRYDHYDQSVYEYNQRSPIMTWIHGAHRDCWYGNSLGGINLWVAIAGVTETSGMIFYPDTNFKPAVYDPSTMFNGEGWQVPPAVRVYGGDGDLIIFNGDMMHSSICNTSDDTRIAITCRINSEEPVFIKEAYWWIQRWVSSTAIENGSMEVYDYSDPVSVACSDIAGTTPVRGRKPDLTVTDTLSRDVPARVLPKYLLSPGSKVLVKFANGELVVGRTESGSLFAIAPKCPHLGVSLADGHVGEDGYVTCPGHGLRFSLTKGTEACTEHFRILAYTAFEDGEWIWVQLRRQ